MSDPTESTTLLEIAAEGTNIPRWAAMMICKAGRPDMTVGEAYDAIEAVVAKAIELDRQREKLKAGSK